MRPGPHRPMEAQISVLLATAIQDDPHRLYQSLRPLIVPMPTPEPWSTLSEAATHLQVAEDTVLRWIAKKGLPAHRAGRVWRFRLTQVDAWLQSGAAAPSPDDEESR